MRRAQVEQALTAAGVPRDAYRIDSVTGDDVFVLEEQGPDDWLTFYLERGRRSDVRRYSSEGAACDAFVATLTSLFRRARATGQSV